MSYFNTTASVISVGNSSITNLAAANSYTFTGEWERTAHPDIMVNLYANQVCTLLIQFSTDGSTVHSQLTKITTASLNEFTTAVKGARYCRVVVTTASLTTTVFSLQTQYGVFRQGNAPENLSLALDSDAMNVRPTDFQDEVRIGRRAGVTGWTKFAYRAGLTAANGEESVWNASGNFTILTSASTFTITYNNSTDGLGTTGALTLVFYYIDSSGLPQTTIHTLGNTGSDVTSFSGLGINRVAVSSSGSADVNTNNITITATTGGSTQALIAAGQSVTQQAIFFTGSNHLAVAKLLWINILKISGGASPRVVVRGYIYNRSVSTKYLIFRGDIDTAVSNILEITDPIGFNLNSTDVLYFTADTDTNNTDINLRFSLNQYQLT